jgi:nucleotide-binding universal stress UspA family protein
MPYKKILCPIGPEENSRAAFETAARLARETHGTLYLMHVIPLPTSIVREAVLSNDRNRAHAALERFAARLPAAQSRVIIVRFGNPAREITAVARRIGADLIVLGTRGRTIMARLFQENVAEKVVADAPCPVLALPPAPAGEVADAASQAA